MARNSVAAIRSVRNLLVRNTPPPPPPPASPSLVLNHHHLINNINHETLTTTSSMIPFPSSSRFQQQSPPLMKLLHRHHRCFCSSPTGGITLLKSEDQFNKSLNKAQDDRHPSVFYFTAAWCGPCKLISPIIEDLSKKYNQVNIYKVDVDQKELQSTLSNLKIYSVPTLHFFHDGKKAGEVVGADVALLKKTMEDLYK